MWNYGIDPAYCENGEREVIGMKRLYQFAAKDMADAERVVKAWAESGVIPPGEYVVTRSIFRDGYYNAIRKAV